MFNNNSFTEIMKYFPQSILKKSVQEHNAEHYDKNFKAKQHFTAMIFGQLSGAKSLRDIQLSYAQHPEAHYHLGIEKISRSTLAEANSRRDPKIFMDVANHLMGQLARKERKELSKVIELIDSSPISLSGRGFDDWTLHNKTNRTQGLKLHVAYNAESETPSHIEFSAPNVNDITVAKGWDIVKNTIYIEDKGYYDFNYWHEIDRQDANFVTRFKKNAALKVIETLEVKGENILKDEVVVLKSKVLHGGKKNLYINKLRRVTVSRPDKKTPLIIATNIFDLSAETIAALYKERWDIELFFKWIKQHLNIKRFISRNENAVKIQIIAAIITYMLLAIYKKMTATKHSMKELLVIIRSTLFDRVGIKNYYKEKRRRINRLNKNQLILNLGLKYA